MEFNKKDLLKLLIGVQFVILAPTVVYAQDTPAPNTLTAPVTTPNVTNTNIEQIKEFSQQLNSVLDSKSQKNPKVEQQSQEPQKKSDLKNLPTTYIKKVEFGTTVVFSQKELNEFATKIENKKITAEDINTIINLINSNYRAKGFITAKAYLPPQDISTGNLKIGFVEGKIGKVIILNNKYTRTAYIQDKIKEQPGDLFELKNLQDDVNNFNLTNPNIKISPKLKAGEKPGTSDLYFNSHEEFPFHLTPSFDNFGRESVGLLRGGIVASHDSVLGYQDRLTSGTYLGRSSVSNFEDYNFPIFNKGTRLGGTFSYSNISVTQGAYKDLDINGDTFLYSVYVQQPIITKERFSLGSSLSTNFKKSKTDIVGVPFSQLDDKSLVASLYARYNYKNGTIYTAHSFTNGMMEKEMIRSTSWYTKYEGNVTNVHNFKNGITNILKAQTQISPHKLESLEQFQLGGMATVRGFSEGIILGDDGYLFSEELLFPIPIVPKKVFNYPLRDNVRFCAFADHGGAFPYRGDGASTKSNDYLTSVGMGLRIKLTRFATARLYWGFGMNPHKQGENRCRFHFDLVSYPF